MDDQDSAPELFLFLASTVHDMKNSISVLSGTLETLLADAPDKTVAAVGQMAHMLYQTKRLNDNLIQLLALYKQVGKPEYPFDVQSQQVSTLVDQVILQERVLIATKNIALEIDVDPELVWDYDEDLMVGVVGHALNNAIHYTGSRIRIAVALADGYLEIRVEDDGAGYPKAILASADCAMSGSTQGVNFSTNSTGLGLYFSSEVVKMHKHRERRGSLRLENGGAFGGGCFVVRLP